VRRPLTGILLALTVLAALASNVRCADPPPAPWSVLLVTLDTTRPDHLGCYGYARPTSPTIDALAARGLRFEKAWSHAAETGPSLATVLTSRRAPVTGVRGNAERLDAALPTLATSAQSAGLRTGAFVSTVLLRRDACAFDRGFDTYDDEMTDPCFGHDKAQRIAPRTVDRAVAWLAASRGPFLCWVHLYDPHGPYVPPEPTPELDATRSLVPSSPLKREWVPSYQRVGDSLDAADYVDRYDREIVVADRHLARLFAAVDPATTLVVLHADHGEALGEDLYWFRHGSLLHDAALRVPWVMAGPGVRAGTVADDVRLLDLAPTVLAAARLPALPSAEGADLSAVLRGAAALPARPLVAEARRLEIVRDATGIDVRRKVRVRLPGGADVVLWPADAARGVAPADAAAWDVAKAWLVEPPRTPVAPAPPPSPRPDVDDALRGLGYR
jgi:arylsulfatase A-like enzyme